MCILGSDCLKIATDFFNKYGLKVTYGKNANNMAVISEYPQIILGLFLIKS